MSVVRSHLWAPFLKGFSRFKFYIWPLKKKLCEANINCMRKLFLSSLFLFALNINSEILSSFSINCKILDQIAFQMNEGKSQRYDGYTDGIDIGEYFSLNFEWSLGTGNVVYTLSVNSDIDFGDKYGEDKFSAIFYDLDFDQIWKDSLVYEGVTDAMLDDDYMYIAAPGAIISLHKYNNNDWHLFYSDRSVNQMYTFVSRCTGDPLEYLDLYILLKKYHLGELVD